MSVKIKYYSNKYTDKMMPLDRKNQKYRNKILISVLSNILIKCKVRQLKVKLTKAIIALNLSLYSRKRCVKINGRINQWH